jgi:hypothetical protein
MRSAKPITVEIKIPGSFAAKLRRMLANLEMPETCIAEFVRDFVMDEQTLNPEFWLGMHTYPNKRSAERVVQRAVQLNRSMRHWIADIAPRGGITYRDGRKVKSLTVDFIGEDLSRESKSA